MGLSAALDSLHSPKIQNAVSVAIVVSVVARTNSAIVAHALHIAVVAGQKCGQLHFNSFLMRPFRRESATF